VLTPLIARSLNASASDRRTLATLLPPVAAASSVLNNTPIVAVLVPEMSAWAARRGKSPSRFLMPISFAAILGGTVTVIGTSTNLVVSGLMDAAGLEPIGFFEMTKLALPIAALGLLVVVLLAPRVLPDRIGTRRELTEFAREFVIDMDVEQGGPLDGVTVEDGGLRHLAGVFLVQVERDGEVNSAVAPTMRLRAGDTLRFAGKADDVIDLHSMPGLASGERDQFVGFNLARSNFFEAVVGASSNLVGSTLKEAKFRSRYSAAVVAIHRAGQRIDAKLGEVPLRVGDTLVVLADPGFRDRWRDGHDFLLVSPLSGPLPVTDKRGWWAVGVLLGVVALAATGVMPILNAGLLGALAVMVLRIVTPGEARRSIDLDVVLLIAGGIGLSSAITSSGLAEELASLLVSGLDTFGSVGTLVGIVIATVMLTEVISNVAAASIVFPISVAAAASLGSDPRGFAIAIAIAASASFLTPIGYQTNVMVYGPGGYRYGDYSRLGAPLTAVVLVALTVGVPLFWGV
jgi:di/tricarboxylate transporter